MTDLAKLEDDTLRQIDEAADEAALEAVRLASLGKKGAISALLATLGKMSPEERKTEGAKINALKDKAAGAIAARREQLAEAALAARLT
ncbi:MAG: phenylalanine--tRNA ligase subunit alpha, partial [Methylocystis sp.]